MPVLRVRLYLLTSAEPTLRWFRQVARELGTPDAVIDDVSADFGILALQGPHAHVVLRQLTDAATPLRFFGVARAEVAGCDVTVSRTGYTGDLGYELWVRADDAGTVWDALMAAWLNPYLSGRVAFEAYLGEESPPVDLGIGLAVDVGADVAFDRGRSMVFRLAAYLGDRHALIAGLHVRM